MPKGRPKKHQRSHEAQAAYRQTEKGRQTERKYESSTSGRERKQQWWRENKGYARGKRHDEFVETYGEPKQVLQILSEREQQVLSLFYGLEDGIPQTLEYIANCCRLSSKQNVSTIKSKALKKLSKYIERKNNGSC